MNLKPLSIKEGLFIGREAEGPLVGLRTLFIARHLSKKDFEFICELAKKGKVEAVYFGAAYSFSFHKNYYAFCN